MTVSRLAGRRILLVGASSGIGRATAGVLAVEGARLALAARRLDRVQALADELPGNPLALGCDVRDPARVEETVAAAVDGLGGLDALVYTVGIAPLRELRDADAESWREAFETNVVGPSLVTRAALDALTQSLGRAIFLSSIAAGEHPPRTGLSLYVTTKAALDKLVDLWQQEHRAIGFTRVSVGDTGSTEMAVDWDPAAGARHLQQWVERGYLFGRAMEPEAVGRHVADLLCTDEAIPVSSITPRYPTD